MSGAFGIHFLEGKDTVVYFDNPKIVAQQQERTNVLNLPSFIKDTGFFPFGFNISHESMTDIGRQPSGYYC